MKRAKREFLKGASQGLKARLKESLRRRLQGMNSIFFGKIERAQRELQRGLKGGFKGLKGGLKGLRGSLRALTLALWLEGELKSFDPGPLSNREL